MIPRRRCAGDAHDESDNAEYQRVPHRAIRRQTGGDVAPNDGVDDPITRREHIQPIGHRLAPRRIDIQDVEYLVRAKRENHPNEESGNQGDGAPAALPRGSARCCYRAAHLFFAGIEASTSSSAS